MSRRRTNADLITGDDDSDVQLNKRFATTGETADEILNESQMVPFTHLPFAGSEFDSDEEKFETKEDDALAEFLSQRAANAGATAAAAPAAPAVPNVHVEGSGDVGREVPVDATGQPYGTLKMGGANPTESQVSLLRQAKGDRTESEWVMDLGTALYMMHQTGVSLIAAAPYIPSTVRNDVLFEAIARADGFYTIGDLHAAQAVVNAEGHPRPLNRTRKQMKTAAKAKTRKSSDSVFPIPGYEHAFSVLNNKLFFVPRTSDRSHTVIASAPMKTTDSAAKLSPLLKKALTKLQNTKAEFAALTEVASTQLSNGVDADTLRASYDVIVRMLLIRNNPLYKLRTREAAEAKAAATKAAKKTARKRLSEAKKTYKTAVSVEKGAMKGNIRANASAHRAVAPVNVTV